VTLVWQISLALEVALLAVFAIVVVTTLVTTGRRGGATISAYPHRPVHRGRARGRHAA
jgi:hypothetical protein